MGLGEAYVTCGGGERPRRRWEKLLKWIVKKIGFVIDLAQDWDRWRNVINAVINLRVL
jgi:hypothetical protein